MHEIFIDKCKDEENLVLCETYRKIFCQELNIDEYQAKVKGLEF